jgi:hypothetical protein
MRSFEILFAVFCFFWRQTRVIMNSLVPVTLLILVSLTVTAQERVALKANIYKNVASPNKMVKVQTIENGRVKATDSVVLSDVQMLRNEKNVVTYEKKIQATDTGTYKRFKSISGLRLAPEDLKIIPEFHVEPGGTEAEKIVYKIVFTSLQPFRYNDSSQKFNARIGFFLIPVSGNGNVNNLDPINIEVVSNDITLIRPEHLQISHLNMPSSNVELITELVSDSASVRVITASNPEGYTTYLKVKPILEILTNRTTLQGYGIQKIPVEVRLRGSNSADSVKVNFTVGKGTVNPNFVNVTYNSPSTIYLSSEGIGDTKLSAVTSNLKSNDLNFRYVFPWVFLLSSILGGLIGGFAKYYLTQKKRTFSARPIIGGILIGFIGAVAYYFLGINLLGLNVSAELNEIAVLGLSALFTYFGISRK